MKRSMRIWTGAICGSLVLAFVQAGCASISPELQTLPPASTLAPPAPASPAARMQPSAQDLDQLVAPIALYPDALVAQILAASTYPTEVVEARRWMQQHPDIKGNALAAAVDSQSWDPGVKALTQFPEVLAMMDTNLSWTSALGDAYVNGQQKLLDAVQEMRKRAQQAGTLNSTPQETVTADGQTIVIAPADPEVVYVPEYDPWLVYGEPLALYPDWIGFPGLYFDGPGMVFDVGIGIGVFGGFGWGWHHWGTDWYRHGVMYDHNRYVSHSPTFGGHHGFDPGHEPFGRPTAFPHASGFPHTGGFPHAGELPHAGTFPHSFGLVPHGLGSPSSGIHSSAFSGFNHGGVVNTFSSRGRASFGGGLHAGGFAGGGFHGGGGHR